MSLKIIYGIIALFSLLLVYGYKRAVHKKSNWFVLLFISVFVVNTGYFAISIANTLEAALWANRLSYFGSVFLPLCMLMIVVEICNIHRTKRFVAIACTISLAVFLLAASGGYTDWYYKSVSLEFINGMAKLVKIYGPFQNLYYIYLLSYLVIMLAIIVFSYYRKKAIDYRHTVFLTCVVLANECVWLVEQIIRTNFEFLSISYIMTEMFMLFLYTMMQDSVGADALQNENVVSSETLIETAPELQNLTNREKEVLKFILEDAKRKDIAETLCVTENTIKKHTTNIYTKIGVTNRKELYNKLNYNPLFK